jgi:putative addiction module killer protein
MYEIEISDDFDRWLLKLRDGLGKAAIDMRVRRLARGNPGDARFVGSGVLELRIDVGPGYRVYYMRKKETVIMLLAGGDKGTQDRDIRRAIELAVGIRSQS